MLNLERSQKLFDKSQELKLPLLSKLFNKFDNLSAKEKVKTIARTLVIILSAFGFLYQTSQLLSIYLSGKTSVDNRVERL